VDLDGRVAYRYFPVQAPEPAKTGANKEGLNLLSTSSAGQLADNSRENKLIPNLDKILGEILVECSSNDPDTRSISQVPDIDYVAGGAQNYNYSGE
jgi:hypothetical protein